INEMFLRRELFLIQSPMDRCGALGLMDGRGGRIHLREEVRRGGLTRLADVHHVPGPLRVAFVPIACLRIVGGFDPFRRWRQLPIGLEADPGDGRLAYGGSLTWRTLIVALPGLTEGGNNRQLPQPLGRLWRVQYVEEVEAILAHGLRIGVALGLPLRQPRIFDPLAIPFIPGQGSQSLEPGRGYSGERVERGAER